MHEILSQNGQSVNSNGRHVEQHTNLTQTTNKAQSFLSRMLSATDWHRLWNNPELELIVKDLQKSGLAPETCQKAKLIPISYWLRNSTLEEPTKRAFLKELLGLSSTIITGQDLLGLGVLGFPYFTADGELAFVRARFYPALTLQEDGKPREVKYLQPSGVPARPYILPEVWEIASKPHKPVWITEGEKKALALLQHGEYAVALSGVWNFRAGDSTQGATDGDKWLWEELQAFNWTGRVVNLAFDTDLWTNPQVRMALFELALKLYSLGAVVRVAQWDRQYKGVDDLLAEHPLEKVKDKSWLELVMPEDLDPIVRAFAFVVDRLGRAKTEQLLKQLSNRLKVSERTLWHTIHTEREQNQNQEQESIPEELRSEALGILRGNVVGRLLQDLGKLYAGREKEKLLLYLTAMSRKVLNLPINLMVVLRGNSSVGKSSLVRSVLGLISQEDSWEISYQSKNFLLYGVEDLSGKVLWLTEWEGSSKGAYNLKLVITEGSLSVKSIEWTKHGVKAINKNIPCQSTAVITTGVAPLLDEELLTRAIVISLMFDERLAGEALELKSFISTHEKAKIRKLWQVIDSFIEPAEVVIPYIPEFVKAMKNRLWAERILRDVDKFLGLVMASALLHQHQRERTEDGKVIASPEDYELVYSLQELFTESFGGLPKDMEMVIRAVQELTKETEEAFVYPTRQEVIKALAEKTGRSEKTVAGWIDRTRASGYIQTFGGGGRGGVKLKAVIQDIPQPQLPFPSAEELFEKESHSAISSKPLQDEDLNSPDTLSAISSYSAIPSEGSDKETSQNGLNNLNSLKPYPAIYPVDTQSLDGNSLIAEEVYKENFGEKFGGGGNGNQETEGRDKVGAYLSALDAEFKSLKRTYGQKAHNISYYFNGLQKVWELMRGVQTIAKIPVANGLSVQQAVEMLRTAWQSEFELWGEGDETPF